MEILFDSKTPDYAWLSNFSPHGFEMEGVYWPSVEHFYQGGKYPGTERAEKIRLAKKAVIAKKLGKKAPRPDWVDIKEEIMVRGLRAKFAAHEDIRRKLIDTGCTPLLHISTRDLYWGIGADGSGKNRLGVLLMELREGLRASSGFKNIVS